MWQFPANSAFPAAIPPHKYDEANSIDLVADGLEMMLRLGWKDGAQIVEVWQDGEIKALNRDQASGRRGVFFSSLNSTPH